MRKFGTKIIFQYFWAVTLRNYGQISMTLHYSNSKKYKNPYIWD